jgi:hypothetical protein
MIKDYRSNFERIWIYYKGERATFLRTTKTFGSPFSSSLRNLQANITESRSTTTSNVGKKEFLKSKLHWLSFVSVFVVEKSPNCVCVQFVAAAWKEDRCRECFRAKADHENEPTTTEDSCETIIKRELPAMLEKSLERVSNDNIQVRQNRPSRNNAQSKLEISFLNSSLNNCGLIWQR